MSEQQLKAFMEAVKADAGLQEQLETAADAEAVVAIAKAAGFSVSANEIKQKTSEISDAELEAAAGGRKRGDGTYTDCHGDKNCWNFDAISQSTT